MALNLSCLLRPRDQDGILILFDTHRIHHCEEQREIEWERGNIIVHLPAGEEDATPVSQRV